MAETVSQVPRDIVLAQHVSPDGVIDIMIDVGDNIRYPDDLRFFSERFLLIVIDQNIALAFRMLDNSVPDLLSQVEPLPVLLENIDDPQALLVVPETLRVQPVENFLSRMPEGCMAEVVPQRHRLCRDFVETKCSGNGSGNLADFK